MIGKSDKCFSPWFGFMVIVVVCVVIAGAVFFETKGSQRRRARKHPRPRSPQSTMQVAPSPAVGVTDPAASGKVLF